MSEYQLWVGVDISFSLLIHYIEHLTNIPTTCHHKLVAPLVQATYIQLENTLQKHWSTNLRTIRSR